MCYLYGLNSRNIQGITAKAVAEQVAEAVLKTPARDWRAQGRRARFYSERRTGLAETSGIPRAAGDGWTIARENENSHKRRKRPPRECRRAIW